MESAELIDTLVAVREQVVAAAQSWEVWPDGDPDRDASARNLLQFLALRRWNLSRLQDPLVALGLSSLGRSQGHVQASLDAVLAALSALSGRPAGPLTPEAPVDFATSRRLLAQRSTALLGGSAPGRPAHIMVTMPGVAAEDAGLIGELLDAGMDCVRINCAHDGPAAWEAILANLRHAEGETRRRARVVVDLPGPKLRTGEVLGPVREDAKGRYLRLAAGERLEVVAAAFATELADVPAVAPESASPVGDGPAVVCASPEAFIKSHRGHRIVFDDGKLAGVIADVRPGTLEVRLEAVKPGGAKLRPGKGINLPDAKLDHDLLAGAGQAALDFATEHAHAVGLSFVSHARDVERICAHLDDHAPAGTGIIMKIETRRAFEHLPGLVLAALSAGRPAGAMIARGDLAVECGWERLAELQQEILWICQAAHLPVIWATEVLDRLARTGRPSRAEITDAATAVQAECVMLNKGPQVVHAVETLDDILRRMSRHQRKNRPLLPRLGISEYQRSRRIGAR